MPASSSRSMLSNIIDRIKLPFRKEKELYLALYNILGVLPHTITFYKVALMHKSLGHRATAEELKVLEAETVIGKKKKNGDAENPAYTGRKGRKGRGRKGAPEQQSKLGKQLNNERLEFLGDAVLDAVVGDLVFRRYPGKPEGFLTTTRSKLVQRDTLGKLAKEMGLSRLIMASARNASHNSYMGGNAFEAIVGALYLDHGYDACMKFWNEKVMDKYLNIDKMAYKEVNFKSKILEWSQKNRITLEFRMEEQTIDSNGSPKFVYTAVLEGVDGCTGSGFSKKEAQQNAAQETLRKLRADSAFEDSVFAAKTARTQMEEMPTVAAPNIDAEDEVVVISHEEEKVQTEQSRKVEEAERSIDELTLDDVDNEEKAREDIIAAAEAEAYSS